MTQLYDVVRFHADERHPDHRKVIRRDLTLEEAQEHCNDPATRSADDEGVVWFDGYGEAGSYG